MSGTRISRLNRLHALDHALLRTRRLAAPDQVGGFEIPASRSQGALHRKGAGPHGVAIDGSRSDAVGAVLVVNAEKAQRTIGAGVEALLGHDACAGGAPDDLAGRKG